MTRTETANIPFRSTPPKATSGFLSCTARPLSNLERLATAPQSRRSRRRSGPRTHLRARRATQPISSTLLRARHAQQPISGTHLRAWRATQPVPSTHLRAWRATQPVPSTQIRALQPTQPVFGRRLAAAPSGAHAGTGGSLDFAPAFTVSRGNRLDFAKYRGLPRYQRRIFTNIESSPGTNGVASEKSSPPPDPTRLPPRNRVLPRYQRGNRYGRRHGTVAPTEGRAKRDGNPVAGVEKTQPSFILQITARPLSSIQGREFALSPTLYLALSGKRSGCSMVSNPRSTSRPGQ